MAIDISAQPSDQTDDNVHTDTGSAPPSAVPDPGTGLVEVTDECGRRLMVTAEEAEKMPKPKEYKMEWYHWLILIILIVLIIIALIYGYVYVALALLAIILLMLPIGQELLHNAICAFADVVREVGSAIDETFGISEVLKNGVMFLGIAVVAYFAIKAFTSRKKDGDENGDAQNTVETGAPLAGDQYQPASSFNSVPTSTTSGAFGSEERTNAAVAYYRQV